MTAEQYLPGAAVRYVPIHGEPQLRMMPYSIRILLENALRHSGTDGADAHALRNWRESSATGRAIDLFASRIFLHDTNGVPTVVDLAAMREAARALGADPTRVNPRIPAELVVDHSVIVDIFRSPDAVARNVDIEFERNSERYRFLRWGQEQFDQFAVVPPGTGIMHQINIEHLARVVEVRDGLAIPDVCLGTDSHTTMVDALGVIGWGIGGIEAEAVMLGEPYAMVVPKVIGIELTGTLPAGSTATDLVLTITERLRQHGVVGTFVEFTGDGLARMSVADRATIANMCPEFGATLAFFPIDQATIDYLRFTGRSPEQVALVEEYAHAQRLWHDPSDPIDFDERIIVNLSEVVASIAGPRRPQDRISLDLVKPTFRADLAELTDQSPEDPGVAIAFTGARGLRNGDVAIAAITSCTNTSNPEVMVAAGLLARNAAAHGLAVKPWVKSSLSPGSRVVTDYLDRAGLTPALDSTGFGLVGYGCMTCIGASGPLIDDVQDAVRQHGLTVAAVLSGNRNFDGRINPDVRLNYLMSPPLVIAYGLAGTMDFDFGRDPLGVAADGRPVMLADIWPSLDETRAVIAESLTPEMFSAAYADVFRGDDHWRALTTPATTTYEWEDESTYLRLPPYFDSMSNEPAPEWTFAGGRALAFLGDQITTDHLSPAGAIPAHTPAGEYLTSRGVPRAQLNTYASRRGNHEVMMRGCLANVRLRNRLIPEREGGYTLSPVSGEERTIYDAALEARSAGIPLLIIGGKLYGAGSSRDWAAKGPALLGVRVVLAESFERIHRSNLIGMGILPLEFDEGQSADSLGLSGQETFSVTGDPRADDVVSVSADAITFTAQVRLDTPRERTYFSHGGIMPYVLRQLIA